MISGIGLDITELDRIEEMDNKSDKFRNRILTNGEQHYYQTLSGYRRIEFLAGRFAAKEAYSKALGTGIGPECSFQDIEILPDAKGAPILYFKGSLVDGFVSITHTKTVAAAQVILQKVEHF
ncbi:holo-ACP synthase [Sporosarcina gallistercoris]|uniref:Holo-[acyl-carrier-protein] synthase n=1 Tax=Sporosarcina gallistercoris TaxID=2762245 RepID=A0ABR8PGS2_9BACL|nr:holo-ACP synthase [Sporosarcina gallistercoris]MBD7907364.1 holo-ACP synthase [Sporosarcina gallistercoris]